MQARGVTKLKPTDIIKPREPIAIVRLDDLSEAVRISNALLQGGISALEFTLTNHKALDAVEAALESLGGEATVGAGTVLDATSARMAILSGAQFLVTPTLAEDVISCGKRYSVPVICGAFTPTEILRAWELGADFVKVFPARSVGPAYFKDVLGPLPDIRLIPTGGVDLDNARKFLDAGAYAVAVGSNLVDRSLVERQDWKGLESIASQYAAACAAP